VIDWINNISVEKVENDYELELMEDNETYASILARRLKKAKLNDFIGSNEVKELNLDELSENYL